MIRESVTTDHTDGHGKDSYGGINIKVSPQQKGLD